MTSLPVVDRTEVRPRTKIRPAISTAALLLLLAACGGDDDGQLAFEIEHEGSIVAHAAAAERAGPGTGPARSTEASRGSAAGAGAGALPIGGGPGTLGLKPGGAGPLGGQAYVVEPNQGGQAASLKIVELAWGRLVDVYDTVPAAGVSAAQYLADPLNPDLYEARLVFPDFLIGEDVRTEFVGGRLKWELSTQPVTGAERLRIGLDVETSAARFALLLDEATAGLVNVDPKCPGVGDLPPYTTVPRNAALGVRFDDLVDAGTVLANSTVKVLVGAGVPFEAWIAPDLNYGDVVRGAFHTTRVLVDFTVSAEEQQASPDVLALNGLGLPPSPDSVQPNVSIAFPTKSDPALGQFTVLANLVGSPLDPGASGPVPPGSGTLDVTWCLRSGNALDPSNGFLPDVAPPQLLSFQPVTIVSAAAVDSSSELRLVLDTDAEPCLFLPTRGDVIRVSGSYFVEVDEVLSVQGTDLVTVRVDVPFGVVPLAPADLAGAAATYSTFWRSSLGEAAAPCFVGFTPQPAAPSPNPLVGVDPQATVVARFNEPIDPDSARPFDSFYVARAADVDASLPLSQPSGGSVAPLPNDLVVGETVSSADLSVVRFVPSLPLTHAAGQAETYFFRIFSENSDQGVTDLAGNALAAPFPGASFSLDPVAPGADTGGWVLRFNSFDEDAVSGPEIRGQVAFDLNAGQLRARPVQRFPAVVDRTQPVVGAMVPLSTGLQTPLSSLGSKAHLIWRYMDAGFDVSQTDDAFYNLDLEGLALAPFGGQVTATDFDEFEIRLGHARNLPDEVADPGILLPKYPSSGFGTGASYADNFLVDPAAGPSVVHPRSAGFAISPADLFVSATGTTLLPMPWNQGVAEQDKSFFTWRDTAIEARGNVNGSNLNGAGAPTEQELTVLGLPALAGSVFGKSIGPPGGMTPLGVPSPGLPLLMEFRCYPGEALDVNSFDVSLAVASSPRPFFRAFSTGGSNAAGQLVIKDPDLEDFPTGGFNQNPAVGPLGAATLATDSAVYLGQMDVVVRVSRAVTVLVDAEQNPFGTAAAAAYDYAAQVVEPSPGEQPPGTALVFAWRGSDVPSLVGNEALTDASRLDVFGEPLAGSLLDPVPDNPVFPWGDPRWFEDLNEVDGQRFVQSRVTFVANAATLMTPSLDSYALAFYR